MRVNEGGLIKSEQRGGSKGTDSVLGRGLSYEGESKRTGVWAKTAASALMHPSKAGEHFAFTKETIYEEKHGRQDKRRVSRGER